MKCSRFDGFGKLKFGIPNSPLTNLFFGGRGRGRGSTGGGQGGLVVLPNHSSLNLKIRYSHHFKFHFYSGVTPS